LHPTTDLPWAEFLKQDLQELITCDAVFLLKGWEKSRGATLEAFVAYVLGLRLYKMHHDERFELYEPEEFLADLNFDLLVRGINKCVTMTGSNAGKMKCSVGCVDK